MNRGILNRRGNHPETVAIIPARGGSKGIPRKNIAILAGKPLIAYSILAAKHSKHIDRIIVSTEDEEIAEVARIWGAEVPFLRPKELAEDNSSVGDALSFTQSKLGGAKADRAWVELYPTSPFRTPAFIDNLLEILFSGYSSIITVKQIHFDRRFLFIQDENRQLINLASGEDNIPHWKEYYRQYATLLARWSQQPEKHYFYVLKDKCMLIDIDTPSDLLGAETIINNGLFDFSF